MNSETLADIVAEKRSRADEIERDIAERMKRGEVISDQFAREVVADLRKEAVRIEAAAKRETRGNMAAMREALEFADRVLRMATEDNRYGDDVVYLVGCMLAVARACRSALSAPPRNCDVGTAAEQSRRFCAFCRPRTEPCDGCSCLEDAQHGRCEFIWAQMPYEESEGAV